MEYKGKAAMFIEFPFVGGWLKQFFPNATIDYTKLVNYIENKFGINIYIKTVYMPKPEDKDYSFFKIRDKLSYLGFCVKFKESFYYKDFKTGENIRKCNFDSKISINILKLALSGKVDCIVLFAADIDYFDIIEEAHELGVNMIVIGFQNTYSEIRNAADNFISIETIKDEIMMPAKTFVENGESKGSKKDKKKPELIKTFVFDEYWNEYYRADNIENLKSFFVY